jgi:hypothetical protein
MFKPASGIFLNDPDCYLYVFLNCFNHMTYIGAKLKNRKQQIQ